MPPAEGDGTATTGEAGAGAEPDAEAVARGTLPEVGLLHTQVGGALDEAAHDPYAPSELAWLAGTDFDYWALGHVHRRQELHGAPAIHYPGNLQGRNPRETGAKGALLVDLSDRDSPSARFHSLAPLRWETLAVDGLDTCRALEDLVGRAAEAWRERSEADPYPGCDGWLLRVELRGPTPLWRELARQEDRVTLEDELAERLGVLDVELRAGAVHPPVDVEEHVDRRDVLGEALRLARSLRAADNGAAPRVLAPLGIDPSELAGFRDSGAPTPEAYAHGLLEDAEREILTRLLDLPESG